MELNDIVGRLSGLGGQTSLSISDKVEIERIYKEVTGKDFIKTSCNDCYKDAVIEMNVYIKKNGKMKEKTNYGLKNGVLLQMDFGSSEMYTNENLTDEVAERYLAKNSNRANYFAVMPTDWKERVEKRINPSVEYNQDLLDSMIESLQDGVSEDSVANTLKDFQINGKKITKKMMNLHLSKAIEIVSVMKDDENNQEGIKKENQE